MSVVTASGTRSSICIRSLAAATPKGEQRSLQLILSILRRAGRSWKVVQVEDNVDMLL